VPEDNAVIQTGHWRLVKSEPPKPVLCPFSRVSKWSAG